MVYWNACGHLICFISSFVYCMKTVLINNTFTLHWTWYNETVIVITKYYFLYETHPLVLIQRFNLPYIPLWPSVIISWHRSESTLAKVIACCLTAPSHYLNQCWILNNEILWHSLESNFKTSTEALNLCDEFETYTFKTPQRWPRWLRPRRMFSFVTTASKDGPFWGK